MKHSLGIFFLALLSLGANDWKVAQPGWAYEFPRDHHLHAEFKTEWWYFTGNLADANGRRFGYQLTFFRQGIRPPAERAPGMSRFIVGDLKFAHFTITDVDGQKFHFEQRTSRGAFGEAGFDQENRIAWIDDWSLAFDGNEQFELRARGKETALHLNLRASKPPVVHGEKGVSAKAEGEGHGSHYYSLPRLETTGDLSLGKEIFAVRGQSWFDHEWATNQLAPGQAGWNWLSVQFDDGTELMLYQMRLENGAIDPSSSGTFIDAAGRSAHLASTSFHLRPIEFWKSRATGANYPIGWQVEIPERQLQFEVRALLKNQELALEPLAYWEGAVEIVGTRAGQPIGGRGYLELTGYAGALRELQR